VCDECVGADGDGDGVCDGMDNCREEPNADQMDVDGDGAGDRCDPCSNDAYDDVDGDGVCGDVDNCPGDANASQEDTDGDGVGDECVPTMPGQNPTVNESGSCDCRVGAQKDASPAWLALAAAGLVVTRRRRSRGRRG
jgi:MYXO-CTERM domain-containing protein